MWDQKKYKNILHEENDILIFLRKISIDLLQNRFVKIIIYLTTIMHTLMSIATIYFLLMKFEVEYFLRFAPNLCIILHGLVACLLVIKENFILQKLTESLYNLYWCSENVGKSLELKVKKESRTLLTILIINLILAFFSATFLLPFEGNAFELFSDHLFQTYVPQFQWVLTWIFSLNLYILAYMMIVFMHMILYFVYHTKYQIYMLNEHLSHLCSAFDDEDLTLVKCINYQSLVKNRLCFIIKHHVILKRMCLYVSEIGNKVFIIFSITGTLLGIATLFLLVTMVSTISNLHFIGFSLLLLCAIITIFSFARSGQDLADNSLQIYYLATSLPWYNFNKENRKQLLLLILHSKEPLVFIRIMGSVDYTLAMKVGKYIFTSVITLIQITNNNLK